MPRKQFLADLEEVTAARLSCFTNISRGADDNEIVATYQPPSGPHVEMTILILDDMSAYPNEHSFMIFTQSSEVPKIANAALERLSESSLGIKLSELFTAISEKLGAALATGASDNPLVVIDSDVEMVDISVTDGCEEEAEEEEDDDDDDFDDFDDFPGTDDDFSIKDEARNFTSDTFTIKPEAARLLNKRIKQDLRAAKFAGFNVGVLGGMKAESISSLLSLSIRLSKLSLSEEALQAWGDLEPSHYFVLLFRYSSGYKAFESVIGEPVKSADVAFRVGVCRRYKPTFDEALAAFTDLSKRGRDDKNTTEIDAGAEKTEFSPLFISTSMNDFLNDQFISLLKIRKTMNCDWDEAKHHFNEKQSRLTDTDARLPATYTRKAVSHDHPLNESALLDHLIYHGERSISFPLLTAQFALRYMIRCTDYCLICHDLVQQEFEALKPYVCQKPLCLYQYMSLGFGPSVEHEIMTQPYVVDLLISLCYAAAMHHRLRSGHPTGMSLAVPPVLDSVTRSNVNIGAGSVTTGGNSDKLSELRGASLRYDLHEIIFDRKDGPCPVRNGDWVVLMVAGRLSEHCRVEDVSLFPTVKLSDQSIVRKGIGDQFDGQESHVERPTTPQTTPPPVNAHFAAVAVYNENFDDMNDVDKDETIVALIDSLPSIKELRSYLFRQSQRSMANLKTWKERISPAALGILRWIIASNRSCLVQVDKCPEQDEIDATLSKVRPDQRLSKVADNWVQFRWAQGAPDREQKFRKELSRLRGEEAINPQYPTLFAFHGSPVYNWHSIMRTGLDFKETAHGRAFGHGVYHALDQKVSVSYAPSGGMQWEGSSLRVASAMSLNEIINCPNLFKSKSPYLVVDQVDWIQCRYLLIQSTMVDSSSAKLKSTTDNSVPLRDEVAQDPAYTAHTTMQKPLGVPHCVVTTSRDLSIKTESHTSKKRKQSITTTTDALMSEGENLSDIEFLYSEDENKIDIVKGKAKLTGLTTATNTSSHSEKKPLTDFVPGSLEQSTLPMLEPPHYATPIATKTLSRALKEILAIQKSTPTYELGWYIDEQLISNLYQWIVELHSFDPSLPLAQDMKGASVTSIVLEIRFGKDFPFSPPFVRVIRPRFLPFTHGGGGHVTGGGAMCMELLTNTGWSSVSTIESVLLQVRMAIMNLEPRPARLESMGKSRKIHDYSTHEAIEAYRRACQAHGWHIPPGLSDFIPSDGSNSLKPQ